MARRLLVAIFIALLISGGFTLWLSKKFVSMHSAKPATQRYIATARDIEAGESLRAADLQQINWPSNMPIEGAFLKQEDVIGRTVLYPLAKGEPILQRQISALGMGVGLATKVPDGMRAISLKSDQVVGVAGFLLPGTHIDVLVTYRTPESPDPLTSTVLQDVEILAAGQKMEPDPTGKANTVDVVTILVTPPDAEKVVLASAQGTVHFVLRNGSDHEHIVDQPARLSMFSNGSVAKPVAHHVSTHPAATPAQDTHYQVQILRGDKASVETF